MDENYKIMVMELSNNDVVEKIESGEWDGKTVIFLKEDKKDDTRNKIIDIIKDGLKYLTHSKEYDYSKCKFRFQDNCVYIEICKETGYRCGAVGFLGEARKKLSKIKQIVEFEFYEDS